MISTRDAEGPVPIRNFDRFERGQLVNILGVEYKFRRVSSIGGEFYRKIDKGRFEKVIVWTYYMQNQTLMPLIGCSFAIGGRAA